MDLGITWVLLTQPAEEHQDWEREVAPPLGSAEEAGRMQSFWEHLQDRGV